MRCIFIVFILLTILVFSPNCITSEIFCLHVYSNQCVDIILQKNEVDFHFRGLKGNNISTIRENAFSGLTNLRTL